jgi:hypothetical protein
MKIASFDIGIKNMAYCVFETHTECLPNIIDWGVVNLTDDEVHFCSGLMKNGQPCKSKAKYRGHQNTEHFLCEKHVKSGDFIFSLSHIKKKKKSELIEFLKSHFISCENMNRDELMEKSLELCQRKLLVKIEKSNANFVDLVKIGQCIKEKFNNLPCMTNLDRVYIENQISPIASRMKTIQGMLSQYFIMKYDTIDIHFCSSINKLKQMDKIFEKYGLKCAAENDQVAEGGSKYRQHKKDAVYYCSQICDKQYAQWSYVMKTTKKDDLADCFLQGLYYIL